MRRVFSTSIRAGILSAIFSIVFLQSQAPGTGDLTPVHSDFSAPSPIDPRIVGPLDLSGPYITINVALGEISLRTQDSVLLTARCSAGSGAKFKDPRTLRVWDFSTPNGLFFVRRKAENPVWRKPDWAFLEEGLPIPTDPTDRLVENELGDYSLDLGGGLFIHGTIYTRLLGMNVTHGCIRVDDDELKMVYEAVQVGTPVIIFGAGDPEECNTPIAQRLEIDFAANHVRLKMVGYIAWDAPFKTIKMPTRLRRIAARHVSIRQISAGYPAYNEREIRVAAEELRINPNELQRMYPKSGQLILDDNTSIIVYSHNNNAGVGDFSSQYLRYEAMRFLGDPLKKKQVTISLKSEALRAFLSLAESGSVLDFQ